MAVQLQQLGLVPINPGVNGQRVELNQQQVESLLPIFGGIILENPGRFPEEIRSGLTLEEIASRLTTVVVEGTVYIVGTNENGEPQLTNVGVAAETLYDKLVEQVGFVVRTVLTSMEALVIPQQRGRHVIRHSPLATHTICRPGMEVTFEQYGDHNTFERVREVLAGQVRPAELGAAPVVGMDDADSDDEVPIG